MVKKTNYFILMKLPILLLCLMSGTANAGTTDYETHWAAKEISKWQSSGIIHGYPDGSFKPDAQITRAEFFKVVAETMGITETVKLNFTDVPADAWYRDYVAKAVAAGYVQGDGNQTVRPNDPITRQEASKILSLAFQVPASEGEANRFKDAANIGDWSKGYVGGLAQGGYIKGYEDHTFRPAMYITRAESVKMFDSLAGQLYTQAGAYTDMNMPGNAVINTQDVTLRNVMIQGNLYVTAGVGEGNAVLDNVTVKGETMITGGGENSIHVKKSNLNKVKIDKKGGKIRLAAQENTIINKTEVVSGARLETSGDTSEAFKDVVVGEEVPRGEEVVLKGRFGTVTISSAKVTMESGSINVLRIPANAENASMNIVNGTVDTLEVGTGASITISDIAKVNGIHVLAGGVAINGQEIQKGSVVKVERGVITGVTNPASESSSGGGSGGSTGGSTGGDSGSGSSVQVSGVSLNQAAASLRVGETTTLTATVAPANATNKNVRWSSSNERVAIVENGQITAKADGIAVITVTTEDGNKTAICTVTVTKQPEEAKIYNVTTSINEVSKRVSMEGFVRGGSGKEVAVRITDPQGNVDWIGQTVSGTDGKFTFELTPKNKMMGPYIAALGTNGVTEPVLVMFTYIAD